MLDLAYKDKFDHAFLISNDSDLAPAIHMVYKNFPKKHITTIVPPHYTHSNELIKASSEKAKITVEHIERCLFPQIIYDAGENITRPIQYTPKE
ncbi:MAG: NYN domain-containing protein [Parachlamydiaceae bacterium]|nr:NYN domain-containing protein [Parachlamydiaceae bacterium]